MSRRSLSLLPSVLYGRINLSLKDMRISIAILWLRSWSTLLLILSSWFKLFKSLKDANELRWAIREFVFELLTSLWFTQTSCLSDSFLILLNIDHNDISLLHVYSQYVILNDLLRLQCIHSYHMDILFLHVFSQYIVSDGLL